MIIPSVVEYIKREKEKGSVDDLIVKALRDVGWQKSDIDEAFAEYYKGKAPKPIVSNDYLIDDEKDTNKRLIQKFPFRFKLLFFTMIFLVITVVGGLFFIKPDPVKVLNSVYKNTRDLKSADYVVSAEINFEGFSDFEYLGLNSENYTISITSNGSFDKDNQDKFVSSESLTFSIQNLLSVAFDVKSFPEEIFIKVNDFPDYGYINKDLLTQNWIKIELSGFDNFKPEEIKLTDEQMDEIESFIKENPLVEVSEVMDEEKVDGYLSYHYRYQINKDNLINCIFKVFAFRSSSEMEDTDEEMFYELFDDITLYPGEVWIDKKEKLIRKVISSAAMRVGDFGYGERIKVDTTINFSNFNIDKNIEKPSSYVTLDELYELYNDEMINYYDRLDINTDFQEITSFNEIPKVLGKNTE